MLRLISRFRKDLEEGGVEEVLKTAIETAVSMGSVKKADLQHVVKRQRTILSMLIREVESKTDGLAQSVQAPLKSPCKPCWSW